MIEKKFSLLCVCCALAVALAGCSQTAPPAAAPANPVSSDGHSHDGWWCDEHGMPESVCAQCDSTVAAEMKAKGDWCDEHDRPESQCFVCNPKLEAEFAADYEAKYGKQPPKPHAHDGDHEGHDHDESDDHDHDEANS